MDKRVRRICDRLHKVFRRSIYWRIEAIGDILYIDVEGEDIIEDMEDALLGINIMDIHRHGSDYSILVSTPLSRDIVSCIRNVDKHWIYDDSR